MKAAASAKPPRLFPASALLMCAALALLFFGYESSRAASIALLAAKEVGLGSEALPFTVALGSPAGALILYLYARSIKTNGSHYTLRVSNMGCAAILSFVTFTSSYFVGRGGNAGKTLVIVFYVFREIYVSLLSTQHWSFLASVLDKSSTSYLVSSAGIVSISSAVGSCAVEMLVRFGGVWMLLATSCLATVLSWIFAELAYSLSVAGSPNNDARVPATRPERQQRISVWRDSWDLMLRHSTLKLLFLEAILHQACSNMLNLMFHEGLRQRVILDANRAAIVGRFFASVNIAACGLQCFVMPRILSHRTLPLFIKITPIIVLLGVSVGFVNQSLTSVMLGFGVMKVLEYSVMTSAMEMIYMPMGHEVRYLGKELIRFFGHRLGKSGTSLLLSAASAHFRPSLHVQMVWGSTLTALWGGGMFLLSSHLFANSASGLLDKSNHSNCSDTPNRIERERGQQQNSEVQAPTAGLVNRESKESINSDEGAAETLTRNGNVRKDSEGDFDQTFYYSSATNATSRSFEIRQNVPSRPEETNTLSTKFPFTPSNSSDQLADDSTTDKTGLRFRRKRQPSGELSPVLGAGATLFDASVFDDTGFYMAKEVLTSNPSSFNSLGDDMDEPVKAMVRVGSQHVSLNYLAALSDMSTEVPSKKSPHRL